MTTNTLEGVFGGAQHLFIDSVHQHHVCQHFQCKENRAFERLIKEKGSDYIAVRITKRESFRKYDRQYPYDMADKATPLELIEDTLGYESNHEERISADETRIAFLESLSTTERFVAEKGEEGYPPRVIAEMRGKTDSGSTRWLKHNIKQKAKEFWGID